MYDVKGSVDGSTPSASETGIRQALDDMRRALQNLDRLDVPAYVAAHLQTAIDALQDLDARRG